MYRFYMLYSQASANLLHPVEYSTTSNRNSSASCGRFQQIYAIFNTLVSSSAYYRSLQGQCGKSNILREKDFAK